jgi:MtN3 and saliva related transmembrane protein
MHPIHELTGYLAAVLTTVSFVPQVLRTLRTRDTRAISLGMYLLFSAGVALWLIYGLLIGAWPIILANVVTLGLTLTVLWHKLREGRLDPARDPARDPAPGEDQN